MSPLVAYGSSDITQVEYDFSSDTATVPTNEMFDIMKLASRGDDVFQV